MNGSPLSAQELFELETYLHAALFDGTRYAWEALECISGYILSLPELGTHLGEVAEGAHLVDPEKIYIGPGVLIEAGAYVKGPCYLGEGSVVRHGAYIRGAVLCGSNCVIGHATEIKNSVLLNKAQAAHFAYVGDSILGHRSNLGAGTRLANLRLDGQSVPFLFEGQSLDTGRRKFGAILGDGAQTGCNVVCNPGTVLGPGAAAFPLSNFGGWVPANALVRPASGARIRQRKPVTANTE